jgi:hypothetical protein
MAFRIGLLFYSAPVQPLDTARVDELLEKINAKSSQARRDQPLTLAPFIRDAGMLAVSEAVARKYPVEAFAFDEAGVTFGPLDALAKRPHPTYDAHTDFDLGMRVLLWRCAVIVIVCRDAVEAEEVRKRLAAYHNTYVFFAILPVQDGRIGFVEVQTQEEQKDEPSWLLAIAERWDAQGAKLARPGRKRTLLGYVFPTFNSALIGRPSETIKKRKPLESERCRSNLGLSQETNKKLSEPDRQSLDAVLTALCPYFDGHDGLGTHYSNVFRTTCLLVPLLIVASTVLAVVAAIDGARHDTWHVAEGLLLLAAAILYVRSKVAKHHRKWVENRLIAELLRPTLFNVIFQTTPLLTPPPEEPGLWLDRSRLLLQHLRGLPLVAFDTPVAELLSARVSAVRDYAKSQAQWHEDFASQHRAAARRLTRMSFYGFVVTLFLCAAQLLISHAVSVLPAYLNATLVDLEWLTGVAHTLAQVLLILTLIAAGCAFVVLLLSHQLGFEAITERSSNAAERFERLQQSIKQDGYAADARQLYAWAHECAGEILSEQHSWYRHVPMIRMHL